MAREIQRTRRTSMVTPSSTAARMGVVDVYTPNLSQMTNVVADTMNTLAENQVKVLDAKWQNQFETETNKYFSNKVNSILQSGEKPDLTKFQEETDGYINGVLAGVPERLSINAESFYNQKNLNAFEILRKQANVMEYNENTALYGEWLNQSLASFDDHIAQLQLTTQSPQEMIDGIDAYSGNDLTQLLGSHGEKFDAIIALSGGKKTDIDKKAAELLLLQSVEQKRVNAIVSSFFQNVDPTDVESYNAASIAAEEYLSNYLNNQGGVRGVNYDVFEDETGRKVGAEVVESIVDNGVKTRNRIQNLNADRIANTEAENKLAIKQQYNDIKDYLKDLTSPEVLMSNEGMPLNAEDIKQQFGFTDTQSIALADLNKNKFTMIDMFRKSKLNDIPLSNLLKDSQYEEAITAMGGEKKVIRMFYESEGYQDNVETYQKELNDPELAKILTNYRENKAVPEGFSSFLSTLNDVEITDMGVGDLANRINETYRLWDYVSDGGSLDIKGIDEDTISLMKQVDFLRRDGFDFVKIASSLKKDIEIIGSDAGVKTKKVNNWLAENPVNVTDALSQLLSSNVEDYKQLHLDGVDMAGTNESGAYTTEFSPMIPDNFFVDPEIFGIDLATGDITPAMIMSKVSSFLTAASMSSDVKDDFNRIYKKAFTDLVMPGDNDSILEKKSKQATFNTFKLMANQGYGFSKYMSSDGEVSFEKFSVQNVHNLVGEDELRNSLVYYITDQIKSYEDNDETDLLMQLGFVNEDNEYERPSVQQLAEMIDNGVFYLEWNGNEDTKENISYNVVFNNYEDVLGRASAITSLPTFTFKGNDDFNPTNITGGISLDYVKEKISSDVLLDLGLDGKVGETLKKVFDVGVVGYDIGTKIESGPLSFLDKKYIKELQKYNDDTQLQLSMEINKKFNAALSDATPVDQMNNFKLLYRTMYNITQDAPPNVIYDEKKAFDITSYVGEQYENYNAYQKALVSELLYTFPNVDRDKLYKTISNKKVSTDKLEKLIRSYDTDSKVRMKAFSLAFYKQV